MGRDKWPGPAEAGSAGSAARPLCGIHECVVDRLRFHVKRQRFPPSPGTHTLGLSAEVITDGIEAGGHDDRERVHERLGAHRRQEGEVATSRGQPLEDLGIPIGAGNVDVLEPRKLGVAVGGSDDVEFQRKPAGASVAGTCQQTLRALGRRRSFPEPGPAPARPASSRLASMPGLFKSSKCGRIARRRPGM